MWDSCDPELSWPEDVFRPTWKKRKNWKHVHPASTCTIPQRSFVPKHKRRPMWWHQSQDLRKLFFVQLPLRRTLTNMSLLLNCFHTNGSEWMGLAHNPMPRWLGKETERSCMSNKSKTWLSPPKKNKLQHKWQYYTPKVTANIAKRHIQKTRFTSARQHNGNATWDNK